MAQAPAPALTPALHRLAAPLAAAGLDVVAPLPRPRLTVIVGNTRRLWPIFTAAYRADAALQADPHPLDAYVTARVEAALAEAELDAEVSWGHGEDPPPLQRLAVEAGLGWLSPAHLVVHPVYGPWLGLRAIVSFDLPGVASAPPAPPCVGCSGCGPDPGSGGCVSALERAMAGCGGAPTAAGVKARWRDWAAIRLACPVGRAWAYGEAQLAYHYTHDRAWLAS